MSRIGQLRILTRRMATGGIRASLAHVARHPDRIWLHGRRLLTGDVVGLGNRYSTSDRSADVRWTAEFTRMPEPTVLRMFDELDAETEFSDDLRGRYAAARPEWAESFDFGRFRSLYALVRLLAPETVVETGVHDGLSSSLILKALSANGSGHLVSVDRVSPDLPPTQSGPGWLVPDHLRDRWSLELGDAVRLLPRIAAERAPVDLFLHDSDHSVAHRRFEFTTIKQSMAPEGMILSDDDEPSDGLLRGLAESWDMAYFPPPGGVLGIGGVRPTLWLAPSLAD